MYYGKNEYLMINNSTKLESLSIINNIQKLFDRFKSVLYFDQIVMINYFSTLLKPINQRLR